jgi:homoserine kinase
MNEKNDTAALYSKMKAEQDAYRDWLLTQEPSEILNHCYRYTVREDIVMAMEEAELSPKQARALLKSPYPLSDVYKAFEKVETGHMEQIQDCIESHADDVIKRENEREGR